MPVMPPLHMRILPPPAPHTRPPPFHLHTSTLVQGMDAIPIDLLLGSMSSELFHILRGHLPQEVR